MRLLKGTGESGHAEQATDHERGLSPVPTELSFGRQFDPSPMDGQHKLSLPAMIYLVAVAAVAALVTFPFADRLQNERHTIGLWTSFVILAVGAAVAQVLL